MADIKEIVKGTTAEFDYANDGALWYKVMYPKEERGSIVRAEFLFAVPFEDVAGGHFARTEKAIHLMRWIRKQLDSNEAAKEG